MRESSDIYTSGSEKSRRVHTTLLTLASHPVGRVALAAGTIIISLFIYHYLNRTLPPRVDFYTPLDAAIPFMPWTIFVYLSMYLLFALASLYVDGKEFLKGLATLIVVNLASYVGFVLFTAHYPRPSPATIDPEWLAGAYAWMFGLDPPGNTFPSLHVGTTATAALMLWDKPGRWIWTIWATLICISTLTVKQHFIADVFGGLAVAGAAYFFILRRF